MFEALFLWLWKIWKLLLHLITGKSELERLCERGDTAFAIEVSVTNSSKLPIAARLLKGPVSADDAVQVCAAKRFTSERAKQHLGRCFHQINAVHEFIGELQHALTPYDSNNAAHEQQLELLWELLRPGIRRAGGRHTAEWGEIGFQGHDPATDFRAMGVLGLNCLVDFSKRYAPAARSIMADTVRKNWFGFALAGINLTADVVHLTRDRTADAFYFARKPSLEALYDLFAYTFIVFNAAWRLANPPNVMSFQSIHTQFMADLRRTLRTPAQWPDVDAILRRSRL